MVFARIHYDIVALYKKPMGKETVGQRGEDLACHYLVQKGYKILGRNYRRPWGEIDIVGKAKDGTLVFFEVKTMRGEVEYLTPEDQVTSAKLRKLRRVCNGFATGNPSLVKEERGWRIDLISITLEKEAGGDGADGERRILTTRRIGDIIKHYENI